MVTPNAIVSQRTWYYSSNVRPPKLNPDKGYLLFLAGKEDFQRVAEWYQQNPVKGMGIRKVEIISNPELERGFESRVALLEARQGNVAFTAKWVNECKHKDEERQRRSIITLLEDMAKPNQDDRAMHVKLVPMWHGTKPIVLESIFKAGFANLSLLDPGYFGRGLYGTGEADYAYRVYSKGALLVNWVSFFSAFPVVKKDMDRLLGKGNYQNYDAHFAPVVPVNPKNPQESVFYPCDNGQKHSFTELAVFDSAQVLPRYLVELQPNLPGSPCCPLTASQETVEAEEKTFQIQPSLSNVAIDPKPLPAREIKLLSIHPAFVGRHKQLDNLVKTLLEQQGVNVVLILGPPGIGKTELAVSFANLYLDRFSFIWTIEAQTETGMWQCYHSLAKQLGMHFDPKDSLELISAHVHRFLEAHVEKKPYLLIFDNAEKMPELPPRGHGAVIITSREKLSMDISLSLEPFSEKETAELFEKLFKKPIDESALQIGQILDFYPLAVTQAFHYILQTPGMNTQKYLSLLRENREGILKEMHPAGRYQMSITATWELTFKKLKQESPDALEWLQLSAFLSPEGIPSTWIELYLKKLEVSSSAVQLKKNHLLKVLCDHALVRYDEISDQILVNRFEQDIIKSRLSIEEKERLKEMALKLLFDFCQGLDPEKPEDWPSFNLLKPHLLILEQKPASSKLADMLFAMGDWERQMGCYHEALRFSKQTLQMVRELHGEFNHPDIANSLNFQGMVWNELGDHKQAMDFFTQSLAMRKEIYVEANHPSVAESLNAIGIGWECLGNYQKAVEYCDQSLQMRRNLFAEGNHRDIACSLNALGLAWKAQGKFEKAADFFEQSLKMWKDLYVKNGHSGIARTLHNLGVAYESLHNDQKAIDCYDQALQIEKKLYKNGIHPDLINTLNSLGRVWNRLGNHQKAIDFYEQALKIEKDLKVEHSSHAAATRNQLGMLWYGLGMFKKALSYHDQALKINKELYGDVSHPRIAISLNNMGLALDGLKDHQKAIDFYKKALAMYKTLPSEGNRISMAQTLYNLGSTLGELKDHRAALNFYDQALKIRRELDGAFNHSETATLLNNLGATYYLLGDHRKAIDHFEQAVRISVEILGVDHAETKKYQKNLKGLKENGSCIIQ